MSAINMPQKKGSGLGALIGTVGKAAGVASGDPMQIAGAVAPNSSPLGQAVGLYNQGTRYSDMFIPSEGQSSKFGALTQGGKDMAGMDTANAAPAESPVEKEPIGDTAMNRAIDARQNSPEMLLHQGLQLADDPSLPIDYDTRMSIIEPLLRAKHFGPGGGLS